MLFLFLVITAVLAETCFGPQIEYIGALCGSATSCSNTANSTFYSTNLTRTGAVAGVGSTGWTGVVYSPDTTGRIIDRSNASVLIFDDWVQTGTAAGIVDIYHYNIRISVGENNGVTLSAMSGTFTTVTVCTGCSARNLQHEITVWVNAPDSAIGESRHWLMVRVNQAVTGTVVVSNFPFDYTYNRVGCGTYCPIYVTSNAVATNIHYKTAVFTTMVDDDYLNLMRWSLGYRNSHRQICTPAECPTIEGTFVDYSTTLNTIYTMVLGIDALLGNNTVVLDYLTNITTFLAQFKIDVRDWLATQTLNIQANYTDWEPYLRNLSTNCDLIGVSINTLLYGGNFSELNWKLDLLSTMTTNVALLINNGFIDMGDDFLSQLVELNKIETILNGTAADMERYFSLICSGEWLPMPSTGCNLFDTVFNVSEKLSILMTKSDALNITLYTLMSTQTVYFDDRFDEIANKLDLLISGFATLGERIDSYFYQYNDALSGNVTLLLSKIAEVKTSCTDLGITLPLLIQNGFDFVNANITTIMEKLVMVSAMLVTLTGNVDALSLALEDQTIHFDSRLDDAIAKLDAILLFGVKIDNYYLSFERVFSGNITLIRDDIIALRDDLTNRMISITDLLNSGFDLWGEWNASEIIRRLDLLDSRCLLLNTTITDLFKTQTVYMDSRFDITIEKIDQVISGCAAIGLQLSSYFYAYNDALAGNVTLLMEQLVIIKGYLIQFELELDDIVSNVQDILSGINTAQDQLIVLDGKCDLLNITMHTLFSTQTIYLGVRFDETVLKLDLLIVGLSEMNIKLDNYFWLFNDALAGNTSLVLEQLAIIQDHLNAFDLEFSDISASLGSLSSAVGSIQSQLTVLDGKCDLLNTTIRTLFATQTIYLGDRFAETNGKIDLMLAGLDSINIKLDNYFWAYNDALSGNVSVVLEQLAIIKDHLDAFDLEFSDISASLGSLSSAVGSIQSQLTVLDGKCDLLNITMHMLFATQTVYLGDRFDETIAKIDLLIDGISSLGIKLDNYFWVFNDALAGNVSMLMSELSIIKDYLMGFELDLNDILSSVHDIYSVVGVIQSQVTVLDSKCDALNTSLYVLFHTQTIYLGDRFDESVSKLDSLIAGLNSLGMRIDNYFWSFNDVLAGNISLLLQRFDNIINVQFPDMRDYMDVIYQQGIDFMSPQFTTVLDRLTLLQDLLAEQNSTLRELFLSQTVYLDDRFGETLAKLNLLIDECIALNLTLSGLFRSLNDYLAQEFSIVRDTLQIIVANIGNTSMNIELILAKLDLFSPVVMENFDELFCLLNLLQNMSSLNAININTLIAKLDLQNLILTNHTVSLQVIQDGLSFLTGKFFEFGITLEIGFATTLYGLSQINFTLNSISQLFPIFAENISRIESKIDALHLSCDAIQADMNQTLHELSASLDQTLADSDYNRTMQFLILRDWMVDVEHILGDRFNITDHNLALILDEFNHLFQLIYNCSNGVEEMEDEEMIMLQAADAKLNQILTMTGNSSMLWEHIVSMLMSYFELSNTSSSTFLSLSEQIANLTNLVSTVVRNAQTTSQLASCALSSRCGNWSWWNGEICVDNSCFGIWYRNRQVCSGNGVCVKRNVCNCYEGYWGNKCQYR